MKESLVALRDIEKNYKSILLALTKRSGLTIAEWQLLAQVMADNRTQEQLSEATHLDTSTLSRQLKSLVNKEMLQKTATGRDKRQLIYTISVDGKQAVAEIDQGFHDLTTRIFDRWTDEEKNLLHILLNRLDKSMIRVANR